jgi:hypothetical protein
MNRGIMVKASQKLEKYLMQKGLSAWFKWQSTCLARGKALNANFKVEKK